MRTTGIALAGLLLLTGAVHAQQPPPAQPQAPALDPVNNKLDALLLRWQDKMQAVDGLSAEVTRATWDKAFGGTDVFEGTAKYMKPNLATLHLVKKGKQDVFERFVSTGNFLYEWVPQSKQVRAHQMPAPKPGQVADDNFLSFLFGMKAQEAKRRYDLTLVNGPPNDPNYYYVDILPRFQADKADFHRARLVLMASTFLPRQLWFEQPNGSKVTWDLLKVDADAKLNRKEFGVPAVPQGWNLVRVPPQNGAAQEQPPPRVVRPQGPQ